MTSARNCLLCVTIIFWSLFSGDSSSQGQGCDPGWYGPDCKYKCRCADTNCSNGGSCGSCQGGWFGPECQYVDLAYGSRAYSTKVEITDGDDTTCLKESLQEVNVWLKNATIDERTLDIYCGVDWDVDHVILKGKAVEHLCSVYVSGGRNVALRQKTSQSTTYSWKWNGRSQIYTSEKAVYGDTSGQFWKTYTCSSTRPEGHNRSTATWSLTLKQPKRVNRYVIYFRTDLYHTNRTMFRLQSFDVNFTGMFSHERTDMLQSDYTIRDTKVTPPISHVRITATNYENILTLCEVEIYGDSSCEQDRYGFECAQTCHCAGGEACFVSTGRCPSGCADGFTGETCDQQCGPESYGPGCTEACSQFCAKITNDPRSCDRFNGYCLYGYLGQTCSSPCERGKYGQDCNLTCSIFCVDTSKTDESVCDRANGVCTFGCHSGHSSSFCEKAFPNSPNPVTIGANVGAILGAVLIVLILFFVVRRKRNIKQESIKVVTMTTVLETDYVNDNMQVYETPHVSECENDNLEHVYLKPPSSDYVNSGVDHVYDEPPELPGE